jgi:hypothetical protein
VRTEVNTWHEGTLSNETVNIYQSQLRHYLKPSRFISIFTRPHDATTLFSCKTAIRIQYTGTSMTSLPWRFSTRDTNSWSSSQAPFQAWLLYPTDFIISYQSNIQNYWDGRAELPPVQPSVRGAAAPIAALVSSNVHIFFIRIKTHWSPLMATGPLQGWYRLNLLQVL